MSESEAILEGQAFPQQKISPKQQTTEMKDNGFEPSPGGAFRKIAAEMNGAPQSPTVAPSAYLVPVEKRPQHQLQQDGVGNSFVLGPTPAQKKNILSPKSISPGSRPPKRLDVLQTVNFREKFSSLPEFRPGESPGKLPSLPASPQLFVQSYRKKRKTSEISSVDNLGSDADTPNKSSTPKVNSVGTAGNTFFGPDFNPDDVNKTNGHSDSVNGGAMLSPSAAAAARDGNKTPQSSSLRKTLDTRRQLVMQLFQDHGLFPSNAATSAFQGRHAEAFPTKVCLQLKIREVRQKMMARSSSPMQQPSPTSSSASAPGTPNIIVANGKTTQQQQQIAVKVQDS